MQTFVTCKKLSLFTSTRNFCSSNFNHLTHRIFKNDKKLQLLNKYFAYSLCQKPYFLKNSYKLVKILYRIFGHTIPNMIIYNTFGKVFTAGHNLQTLENDIRYFSERKIHTLADLSIESLEKSGKNEYFEKNLAEILKLIEFMGKHECHFVSIKITSLIEQNALKALNLEQEKLNTLISENNGILLSPNFELRKDIFANKIQEKFGKNISENEINNFCKKVSKKERNFIYPYEIFNNIHAYKFSEKYEENLGNLLANFDPKTKLELEKLSIRLKIIMETLKISGGHCMIDAEQTYLQSGIESIVSQLQAESNNLENNTKKFPIILKTYQAYLKTTKSKILNELEFSQKNNIPMGFRLVRGAYMTEERKIAEKMNINSPIFDTKLEVDKNYDEIISLFISKMPDFSHINIATHNENSVAHALNQLSQQKRRKNFHSKISFGQLKGLGDSLSYKLAEQGNYIYKYIPFGETENLIPYLLRRVEEASYISYEGQKQLNALKQEIFHYRNLHTKFIIALITSGLGLIKLRNIIKNKRK